MELAQKPKMWNQFGDMIETSGCGNILAPLTLGIL